MRRKAYPATAYPGFHSIKPLEEKLFFLGGMKLYNRVTPSPCISSCFTDISLVPIYILGWKNLCESIVSCPRTHNTVTWQLLELRPFDPDCSILANRPLCHQNDERIHIITLDWLSIDEDFVTGVNGTVAFIGESRGEGDGLDTLKGALHSSLDRSSIKLCCCLWVKNQDLFVTLVNVCLHGYIMFNFICCSR